MSSAPVSTPVPASTAPAIRSSPATPDSVVRPTGAGARSGAVRVGGYLAAWAGLTLLGLGRLLVASPSLDMFYGEDGSTFVPGQLRHGLLASLTTSYQGYLHTAPRLLAALAVQFPIADAVEVTTLLAAATTAGLALFVFTCSRRWIPSPAARALLALAMVLLPVAREEVVGNLANLQWPLLFACVWALVGAKDGAAGWVATGVVVVAALSSPISVVLVPVALVVLPRSRGGSGAWRTALCFVGAAAIQLAVMLTAGGSRTVGGSPVRDPQALARGFGARAVLGLLSWPGNQGGPQVPGLVGAAVVALAVGYLVKRRGTADAGVRRVAFLVGYAVLLYVAPALVTGVPSRYAYVPALLLLSAVLVACPIAGRTAMLVLGAVLVVWSASFAAAPYRVSGPSWTGALDHARAQCAAGRTTVRLPVGPWQADGTPWMRPVFACRDLGR